MSYLTREEITREYPEELRKAVIIKYGKEHLYLDAIALLEKWGNK